MSSARVIAFDGTPLQASAGIRTAILEDDSKNIATVPGVRLTRAELAALVSSGHVTAINPGIETDLRDGVVVYRHRDFRMQDLPISQAKSWVRRADCRLTYLRMANASELLRHWALASYMLAIKWFHHGDLEQCRMLAQQGLRIVPNLRTSSEAAMLFGLLLTVHSRHGKAAIIEREIRVLLSSDAAAEALRCHAMMLSSPPSSAASNAHFVPRESAKRAIGSSRSPFSEAKEAA